MIANTLSSLSRVLAQPASIAGHSVSPSTLGSSPFSSYNSSQSHLSSLKPIEALSATDKNLAINANDSSPNSANSSANEASDLTSRHEAEKAREDKAEKQQLAEEQKVISQLASRDREVRAHEQAHAAIGGQYAGAPTYTFQRGPDGVRYAVGGEVSIDVSKAATAEETIRKAQVVRQAALAPAEPSPQDRRVAAEATQIQTEAIQELRIERAEEAAQIRESRSEKTSTSERDVFAVDESQTSAGNESTSSTTTDFAENEIGSRTYQSIAGMSIYSRNRGSVLDQIA